MSATLQRPDLSPGTAAGVMRRPVCFVAWGAVAGRSAEIAAEIGGEARCFFPPGPRRRPPAALRYVLAALGTVAYLLRRRPRVVIVTNPPIFAALVAYGCARLIGATLILDSHPGGFGAQGDRVAARLQRLHRFVVARAALVLVTDDSWADTVRSWVGRAAVLHEAPGGWDCPPPDRHQRLSVLVVGRLAADEPVAEVLAAACTLPDIDFLVTGDPERCPAELRASVGDNVRFVGFLAPDAYRAAVEAADAVLTLTTEPTSVMRAAYEAVYARRPLVISDWPLGRELFPRAFHAANEGPAIARTIALLDAHYDGAVSSLEDARRIQLERWGSQRDALLEVIAATSRT